MPSRLFTALLSMMMIKLGHNFSVYFIKLENEVDYYQNDSVFPGCGGVTEGVVAVALEQPVLDVHEVAARDSRKLNLKMFLKLQSVSRI